MLQAKYRFFWLFFVSPLWLFAEKPSTAYITTLKKITDVMVYDVTSPVASARYYAYINLSAYETLSQINPAQYPTLTNAVKLPAIQATDFKNIDTEQAVLLTLLKTATKLSPSGNKLKGALDSLANQGETGKAANALILAEKVSNQVLSWALTDGFRRLNNLRRYTPKTNPAFWKPTAPAFMPPVEPHWNTIRTFVLDSAQQFKPQAPTPFDTARNSLFYQQAEAVYKIVRKKNKKQQAIAQFWDCNPYAISQIGHIEFGTKKISPGGHWIGIAGIACRKANYPLAKTVWVHTLLSLTMHDAFVVCWDEKYRSNRLRPETFIKQYINPRWQPLLQTPPFPEYVSGHSVVSAASAKLLSYFFGNNFSFTDDTETEFGLPKRKFRSFDAAANEACISRFYGGIHYIDAIEQGKWQGQMVANWVLGQLSDFFQRFPTLE